jgi:hypothetical protein
MITGTYEIIFCTMYKITFMKHWIGNLWPILRMFHTGYMLLWVYLMMLSGAHTV